MKRLQWVLLLFPSIFLLLSGCSAIGDKSGSISMIYAVTAILSLLILICYCGFTRKRNIWYVLLFTSVLVVNIGYLTLAISKNLDEALLANRLAYLGSVFLPLAMFMIIMKTTKLHYRKWLPSLLLIVGAVVFFIAASPGYLTVYYREVTFEKINGVTVLSKVYGPLHFIYLIYLLAYFAAMVTAIVHATLKDRIDSLVHSVILAFAVFVNIGVWLIEQLVRIDFEILSVSYIISEIFLLGLNFLIAENERKKETQPVTIAVEAPVPAKDPVEPAPPAAPVTQVRNERLDVYLSGLSELTKKERQLYDCYIAGMTTAEILTQLNIKENTLKFHNKNLYSKLGVSSRKQLTELHKLSISAEPPAAQDS